MIKIKHSDKPVIIPEKNCIWASTGALNPAIIKDPESNKLHMLFRTTGPRSIKHYSTSTEPYPIFLAYADSGDNGKTWNPDFSRPALAPKLETEIDKIYIQDSAGRKIINYANGCIEDPRIFYLEGELYLTTACRMFPPGAYWIKDDPVQCAPDWIHTDANPFGRAALQNITVNLLYKVDIDKLRQKKYEESFTYITHLTNPEYGENRDVFLFPERININSKKYYAMIHRPYESIHYSDVECPKPSIWISFAETFDGLRNSRNNVLLAEPIFDWESEKIGASFPLIKIDGNKWLLSYHGRKDAITGYTQSFMIIEVLENGEIKIKHRCSERLLYSEKDWEKSGIFTAPCLFTTSGIIIKGTLLMGYGAADSKIGIAKVDFNNLIEYIKLFNNKGNKSR